MLKPNNFDFFLLGAAENGLLFGIYRDYCLDLKDNWTFCSDLNWKLWRSRGGLCLSTKADHCVEEERNNRRRDGNGQKKKKVLNNNIN